MSDGALDSFRIENPARGRLVVRAAAVLSWVLVTGIAAAPALDTAGGAIRAAFHPLCHQLVDRCLVLGGRPMAVCARCAGLYVGGALGLLAASADRLLARVRPRARWMALAAAPTALDAAVHLAGWPGAANLPRLILSIPAGFVAGLYLAVGVADLGGRRWTTALPTCSGRR